MGEIGMLPGPSTMRRGRERAAPPSTLTANDGKSIAMTVDSLLGRTGLPRPGRNGVPLGLRLIAMLVCTLLAAQAVTLMLTVILPPQPTKRWNMAEVVATLNATAASDRLETRTMIGPPDVSGEGWLVSETSSEALASRLGRPRQDVVLAFFTQLPVGGVAVPVSTRSPLAAAETALPALDPASWLIAPAQAQPQPGGMPGGRGGGAMGGVGGGVGGGAGGGPMASPGSGFPTSGFPGSTFPGGAFPGGSSRSRSDLPAGGALPNPNTASGAMPSGDAPGSMTTSGQGGTGRQGGWTAGPVSVLPMPPGGARAMQGMGPGMAPGMGAGTGRGLGPAMSPASLDLRGDFLPLGQTPLRAGLPGAGLPDPLPRADAAQPAAGAASLPQGPAATDAAPSGAQRSGPVAGRPSPAGGPATPQPIPFRHDRTSIFQRASPPFIEGDFVAAVRRADGTWLAVAPKGEAFPNAWQTRIMLWFALSLALISPLAWWMARRIVGPLKEFAAAAEQLGRDPAATILPLSGPAEVGRAANAFNQMRNRIRAFVDDRTAMVGAISHDLRTPLTRMRFRIEYLDEADQAGLLKEVTEMEAMISQVIAFIRDASTPGPRERVDFAELVRGAVSDARLVGGAVEIEQANAGLVDVDPVGIRRLLGNLIENAVKYGSRARVRVLLPADGPGGEIVAEIEDNGPGIPEAEFDLAFEPFYRSASAIQSGKLGHGLGLAVCRSIARAHGGDVSFAHVRGGFVTRVTMPTAFDARPPIAASQPGAAPVQPLARLKARSRAPQRIREAAEVA